MVFSQDIHIGTDNWNRTEFRGILYPAVAREQQYLCYYSDQFDFIEFQNSYFATHIDQLKGYIKIVEHKRFQYCPWIVKFLAYGHDIAKISSEIIRYISHWKKYAKYFAFAFLDISQYANSQHKDFLLELIKYLPKDNSLLLADATQSIDKGNNHKKTNSNWFSELTKQLHYPFALNSIDLVPEVQGKILFLKLDIQCLPDYEEIIKSVPDTVSKVYLSLHGEDKKKLAETLLQYKQLKEKNILNLSVYNNDNIV